MPRPYWREFREDVVRVARNRERCPPQADRRRLRGGRVVSELEEAYRADALSRAAQSERDPAHGLGELNAPY